MSAKYSIAIMSVDVNSASIEDAIDMLEAVYSRENRNYVLIIESNKSNKYDVCSSKGFDKNLLKQIKGNCGSLFDDEHREISTIKPALKQCFPLELTRRHTKALLDHYYNIMSCLSQSVCKTVAKEWIKVAEPKKQALYPYKFFNSSKPPWWPGRVKHIEPDHLDKDGRIDVLISILRNPSFDLRALKLRTSIIRFKHKETLHLINELYYLAFYDRLFFGHGRENCIQADYLENLVPSEKAKILSDLVSIMVSDIKSASKKIRQRGMLMVRQIQKDWINHELYTLNQERLQVGECEIRREENIERGPSGLLRLDVFDSDTSVLTEFTNNRLIGIPYKRKLPISPTSKNIEYEMNLSKKHQAADKMADSIISKAKNEVDLLDEYSEIDDYPYLSQDVKPLQSIEYYSETDSSNDLT